MSNDHLCKLWLLVLCVFIRTVLCCGFLNCTHNNSLQKNYWELQCFSNSSCPDSCAVSYYDTQDSDEDLAACENFKFESSSTGDGLSGFGVLPYEIDSYYNYNISFSNREWNTLRFHSRLRAPQSVVADKGKPACLLLSVPEGFSSSAALFISQRHWGHWAGGYDAELQLETTDGQQNNYSHILFKVPAMQFDADSSDIARWIPLVAVEVSHLPWIGVVWPQLPKRFNVSEYKVVLEGQGKQIVDEGSCDGLFCRTSVNVGYWSQKARVYVSPVHANCSDAGCLWESPTIILEFRLPWYMILLLVAVPLLVVICVVVSVFCFCCTPPSEPVRVLFLFDAVERQHTRAARILQEYLKEVGNVECLYEGEQVPKSASKNASKWLEETMEEATFVLVLASPETHSSIRYTLYPDVFDEALPLLQQRRSCPRHKANGGRVLVAIPPYLNRHDLPDKLRGWPFFYIPSQLDFLLWQLYNPRATCAPVSLLARGWLRLIGCPGPTSAYKHRGMRLREALNAAGAAQTLVEQMPGTPTLSDWTEKPPRKQGDEESNITKVLAEQRPLPGPLSAYPLLRENWQPPDSTDISGSCTLDDAACNGLSVSLQKLAL